VSFVQRQMAAVRDRAYDKGTGVDTVADHPGLEFPDGVVHDDSVYYARTSPRDFARVMKDVPVTAAGFTFVDLGCGKGAALLLALDHGFRTLVGVEANGRLATIAERNAHRYVATRGLEATVQIIRDDVVDFPFPSAPSVLYLYNPFGPETLTAVLGNLERSLSQDPRDVVVAYVSPVHSSQLDRCTFLERIPSRSRKWAIYRSTATP
jgi:SAM-dependent methyltransferase